VAPVRTPDAAHASARGRITAWAAGHVRFNSARPAESGSRYIPIPQTRDATANPAPSRTTIFSIRLGDRRRRQPHVEDVERAEQDLRAAQRSRSRQPAEQSSKVHRARVGGVAGEELDLVAGRDVALTPEPTARAERPRRDARLEGAGDSGDAGRRSPGEQERRRRPVAT